jgi:DNA-binding PadR family transcriptional regulator
MIALTLNELTILLTILRLGDDAYGVKIKEQLSDQTEKDWNYGAMYCLLDQLVKKNLLKRISGDPTHIRGGRRKIYYRITTAGVRALEAARQQHESLWRGFEGPLLEKSSPQ